MLTFADKVGGWGWPNADVSKKKISDEKKLFFAYEEMLTSADKVGGWVQKGQKYADAILEWSLT